MDRVIEKKKWSTRRILTILGIASVIGLIGASYYFTSGKSRLNVPKERITISEIKKGPYKDNIPVNGMVLPINTILLDATEGGRVEEKFVEDGAIMKKDQPILKLSNTDLALNLLSQQSNVYNTLTQMRIASNAAQQNTVQKLNQMTDVESQLKEAERIYKLDKTLLEQKVIGLQEFKKAENDYNYQVDRKRLTQTLLQQDSISNRQQVEQARQSYSSSQRALDLYQKKIGDLIVRAPVDGQLTSLTAEIGQNINKGDKLGQLDILSGFKVRVDPDEHYISRVFVGQTGEFSFANKNYKLRIKKVFTQVTNARFQVDMEFVGEVPQGIRRGQTLQITLSLSDETTAILLPRGGFYQKTGGNWIFKVSADGKTAYRVDIQLGRQSIDYYEVIKGLEPGDKVITSSYDSYGDIQELVLKD